MKMFKTIAVAALLLTSASASYAAAINVNGGVPALLALGNASSATVIKVNANEARYLAFDTDIAALQQRLQNNPGLARTVMSQGYALDQIVGISADGDSDSASITLYAL